MKAPPDAALASRAASRAASKARRAAKRGGSGGSESGGGRDFRRYTSPSGFAVLVVSRQAGTGADAAMLNIPEAIASSCRPASCLLAPGLEFAALTCSHGAATDQAQATNGST